MRIKKIKLKQCPNCDRLYKIVIPCSECGRLCCNDCSIDKACINCYVKMTTKRNVSDYFRDKYRVTA